MPIEQRLVPLIAGVASVIILALLWKWRVLRSDAFGSSPKQQRDVWQVPAPVWFVAAAMVFLALKLGQQFAFTVPPDIRGPRGSFQELAVAHAISYPFAILVAFLLLWLLKPRTTDKTGLRARTSDFGPALVALLCAIPICLFLGWFGQFIQTTLDGKPTNPVSHQTLQSLVSEPRTLWWWIVVAAAVIGAPVVEEILWRGFLQSSLLAAFGRTWPAILITSTLFAAIHYPAVPLTALPTLFALAVAMGIAFERTRSLGVPIIMHVLFNLGNVVLAVLTTSR